jgi:Kelch motif
MWYQPDVRFPDSSEPVPGPRAAHSCNLIGNKLFVFGGWNGKKGLNDLNVLNVDTMEWSLQRVMELFVAFNSQHGCVVVLFSF